MDYARVLAKLIIHSECNECFQYTCNYSDEKSVLKLITRLIIDTCIYIYIYCISGNFHDT